MCIWGRFIAVVLLLFATAAISQERDVTVRPRYQSFGGGEKWAIIVGVNEYEDSDIQSLKYSVSDAQALYDLLTDPDHGGFEREKVILLTDDTQRKPTRTEILRALTNLKRYVSPTDTVFLSFSGHGIEQDGVTYLVPSDGVLDILADEAISVERFYQAFGQASVQVAFLDACHSGISPPGSKNTDQRMSKGMADSIFKEAVGRAVLSSCLINEKSWEYPEKKHGAFSYFLLEGLKCKADSSGDGYVTVSEVSSYVTKKVKAWAFQNNRQQTPNQKIEGVGDILLTTCEPSEQVKNGNEGFGLLHVKASVDDARVFVDGQEVGKTSYMNSYANTAIPTGNYTVKVTKSCYHDYEEMVTIVKDKKSTVDAVLKPNCGLLEVSSFPTKADVKVVDSSGTRWGNGITPFQLPKLPSGVYSVTVSKKCYPPKTRDIVIFDGKETVEFILDTKCGTLKVESSPTGATVFLAGSERGSTTLKIEVDSGKYILELRKKDYLDWSEEVEIRDGKQTNISPQLEENFGRLEVEVKPEGSQILVDGEDVGLTPKTLRLPPASYRVEVRSDGYISQIHESLIIVRGEVKTLKQLLEWKMGTLRVLSTPDEARITIDGQDYGLTPNIISLPTGRYKLKLSKESFKDYEETVDIVWGETVELRIELSAAPPKQKTGTLQVRSTPNGARITIDGQDYGLTPTPRPIRLPTGSYKLKLSKKSFNDHEETVDIVQDKTAELDIKLSRPPKGMVLIPAGEFSMGSNDGDDDEKPAHTVYLDAFYMDEYEVTNADYKKFIDANPQWQKDRIGANPQWQKDNVESKYQEENYLKDWNNNNHPLGKAEHPVVYVSWHAANAYAEWDDNKRLPTEAEWEKAARGELSGKKYPWGDRISHDDANYSGTGGKDIWNGTSPVGSFDPNGYGLYNMAGNVSEWCVDWYDKDYYSSSPFQNPTGPKTGGLLVARGGSWLNLGNKLRCAGRFTFYHYPSPTNNYVGFRCVK